MESTTTEGRSFSSNTTKLLKHLDKRTFTGHSAIEMVNGFVEANKEYANLIYNVLDSYTY